MLDSRERLFLVLAAIFSTCLVVGDLIGGKLIQAAWLGHTITLTVGMIPFPVTFLLTDVLNEFYGKQAARFVTLVGFAMAVLSYTIVILASAIPIAAITRDPSWQGVTDESFRNVFLSSQRIIIASMSAYIVAQFADIGIFHLLKRATSNRMLWLRATGSTAVSQLIDTVVVTIIAWAGILNVGEIENVIVSSYGLKIVIALGLTPLVYVMHAVVQRVLGIAPVVLDSEGRPISALPAKG